MLRLQTSKTRPFSVQSVPTEARFGYYFQKGVSSKTVSQKSVCAFSKSNPRSRQTLHHPWARYFVVDFEPGSDPTYLFTDMGISNFQRVVRRIGRIAVIVSTVATISSSHKDGNDALVIVLAGSKTFRVRTDGGTGGPHPFGITRQGSRVNTCPKGWTDIIIQCGDALYVPKGQWHAVLTSTPSILLSMTIIENDESERGSEEMFGRPDSPQRSDDDSSDSSPDLSCRRYFESQSESVSALSQMTLSWRVDGMSMVAVFESVPEVESALLQVREAMFDDNMALLPGYSSEYVWGKLFGQKHIDQDYDDPKSGRLNTGLLDLSAFNADLGVVLKKTVKAITAEVASLCRRHNPDMMVTVSSSALLVRLRGRIPAQRIHVDGSCDNFGHGTELSCMAALNNHHGVAFVDLSNGVLLRPHLRVGRLIVFDHTGRPHLGHSSICDNEDHVTAAIVFITYHVRTASETVLKVRHDKVDDSPDKFLRHETKVPAVTSCVVCESPIFERVVANLRQCPECNVHQQRLQSLLMANDRSAVGSDLTLSMVCHICVHTPVRAHSDGEIEKLSQMASTESTVKFMMNSILCDCDSGYPHLRLCNHSALHWQPFVQPCFVLLFFQLSELKEAACWLIVMHLNNVLLSQYMLPNIRSMLSDNPLQQFLVWAGNMCARRTKLVDVMCQFVDIQKLSGQILPQFTLICDTSNSVFLEAFGRRIDRLARFVLEPWSEIETLNNAFMRSSTPDIIIRCECTPRTIRGGYAYCVPRVARLCADVLEDDDTTKGFCLEMENVKTWLRRKHGALYAYLVEMGMNA